MSFASVKPVIATFAVLLVGCVVGGLGFALGRDSADPAKAQQVAAVTAGHASAKERRAAYHRGYAAGRRDARPRRTYHDGFVAGARRGASQALGGPSFDFAPATFYIVQFAPGERGDGLRITDSHEMASGVGYELCNTNDLCQRTP